MTAASSIEPGQIIAGRYRVESKLGEGGMGIVYLVRHVHTDETLALKVVHAHVLRDASAIERFRREARAPAKIASEHVCKVTDADTAPELGGAPFYVMELLRGRDLEKIIQSEGPIPPPLAVEYLRQAARALDKAHAIGVVHRDLKPENLFLTHRDDGTPCIKLLDFGIARLGDADVPGAMKTQAGFVFGTPGFMAPEQMLGEVDRIGPAADIWALGFVAFRIMVAQDFWEAKAAAQLCAEILTAPIPPPSARGSTLGPGFDAWFLKCASRNIDDRFKTAGDAVAALADALGVRFEGFRSSASLVAAHEYMSGGMPAAVPIGLSPGPASVRGPIASVAGPVEAAPPRPKSPLLPILAAAGALAAVVAAALVYVFVVRAKPTGLVAAASAYPVTTDAGPAPGASAAASAEAIGSAQWPDTAPSSSVAATDRASTPHAASPAGKTGKGAGAATATGGGAAKDPGSKDDQASLSREQRRRLESLQRLCDQGTFTPDECRAKRIAIMRGER
jgi:serine/threonine-protein kinase